MSIKLNLGKMQYASDTANLVIERISEGKKAITLILDDEETVTDTLDGLTATFNQAGVRVTRRKHNELSIVDTKSDDAPVLISAYSFDHFFRTKYANCADPNLLLRAKYAIERYQSKLRLIESESLKYEPNNPV